jgi:hypothetical protein
MFQALFRKTKKLKAQSVTTAVALFKLKTQQITSYATEIIWQHVTYSNMRGLQMVNVTSYQDSTGIKMHLHMSEQCTY